MKAAVLKEARNMVIEEVSMPDVGPQDVLVNVKYCGLCGTDAHVFAGDKGSAPVTMPVILGHEFAGDVAAVGSEVSTVAVGDRVCADVNYYCDACTACRRGEPHLCEDMVGVGTARNGALAEFIAVPQKAVFTIPPSVSYQEAAMVEPLSCCLHGIDRLDVRMGDTVAVVGAGLIGLLMLQLVRRAGAGRTIVIEPFDQQREKAAALGASLVIDPTNDVKTILRMDGFELPDVVIDCAGTSASAEMSIEIASRGATVMLFGLTGPEDTITVRPFEMFQKELTLTSSFVNPFAYGRALRLIESGAVDLEGLVARTVPLDEVIDIFTGPPLAGKTQVRIS